MAKAGTETMTLRPDQVWQEDDKRFVRHVRIQFICLGGKRVRIKRCLEDGSYPHGARSTEADVSRFGRRGGYKLVRG